MADFNGGPGADRYVAEEEGTERERNRLLGNDGDDTLVGGLKNDALDGGADGDRLIGNGGRDFIEGRAGDDYMDGGDGNDQLRAEGGGDDTVIGGGGNDVIWFGGGNQVIRGGDGDDQIIWQFFVPGFTFRIDAGEGDDRLAASSGADRFDGGEGRDLVDYSSFGAIRVDLAAGVFKFGAAGDKLTNVEDIIGSLQGDTIVGTDADNDLDGYFGNDVLVGGAGADRILGFFGSDRIDGGAAEAAGRDTLMGDGDIVDSANEVDTLVLASATSGVVVDLIEGTAKGGARAVISGFEKVEGSAFDDELLGSDDNSRDGADALVGASGNDRLVGRAGDDSLTGGEGDDTLQGGVGRDELSGRAGRDIYVYGSVAESSSVVGETDLIFDLRRDDGDRIDLRQIDADGTTAGDQKFRFVGNGPFEQAGDLRFEPTGRGFVIYGDVDGDGTEDFQLEIGSADSLGRADFLL